jgi:hypothetical protein
MSEPIRPVGSGEELNTVQINGLLDLYERTLSELGYNPVPYPDADGLVGASVVQATRFDCLNHAYWMCGCIRRFFREARYARVYRWLGQVQGLLFMGGVFSQNELQAQERDALGVKRRRRVVESSEDACPAPGDGA